MSSPRSPMLRDDGPSDVSSTFDPLLERVGVGSPTLRGFVHPDFADVPRLFRTQLRKGNGGAAVAVYHHGKAVVDLRGGSRNDEEDPWLEDTLAMCFSTTKGVTSTAVHVLASRGLIDYDAPVARYWPEFAQNGKEDTTVADVLTHSAGLHRMRTLVDTAHRMLDWEHMTDALAKARPVYEPGTESGYHGLTYGWLAGELVRRVDGRTLARFVDEEIAQPLGLDGLYIGCPESERHRVATLRPLGNLVFGPRPLRIAQRQIGRRLSQILSALRVPFVPQRLINTLIPRYMHEVMYAPELMDAEVPSANGFFTARSLARMYAMIANHGEIDGVRLLSRETVDEIAKVRVTGRDRTLGMKMNWRLGYHQATTVGANLDHGFGHFGFGGSGAWADPTRELSLAMTCNRGTGSPV
ncbi:MAG: serine hydrolase domain-containing protein, partial [Aeromicrobium sp.]